jgi:hypothetical protein
MARRKADKRSSGKTKEGAMGRRVRGKALFDFVASPDYPEQVSLSKDETFTVVQDFSDGWTRIKTAGGVDGVVPTSYYTKVPLTTLQIIQDSLEFMLAYIGRVLGALARLITGAIVAVALYIGNLLYDHAVYPVTRYVMRRFRHNETAQTFFSSTSRKVYTSAFRTFLSGLSDLELDDAIAEVEDYVQMAVEEERGRIPTTRSSFVREPLVRRSSKRRKSKQRASPEPLSTLLHANSPRSSASRTSPSSRRVAVQE